MDTPPTQQVTWEHIRALVRDAAPEVGQNFPLIALWLLFTDEHPQIPKTEFDAAIRAAIKTGLLSEEPGAFGSVALTAEVLLPRRGR